jgi:hypothetical protein
MLMEMVERVGCSWLSEDRATSHSRAGAPDSAQWHDAHGEDFTRCDAWLCVCGRTDPRGGTWQTSDIAGKPVEPTGQWAGHMTCLECGRVYDRSGLAVSSSDEAASA